MKKTSLLTALCLSLSFPAFAADTKTPEAKTPPAKAAARPRIDCDFGPGMMGGHGMGIMGGYGRGMMGGYGMTEGLKLNAEQRAKINKLSDELRHNNWTSQGAMMDESAKLRDLYAADKRDPSAIGKIYQKIFDLKRQMIEASIDTQNRIEELLSPEQKAQLRERSRTMHGYSMMP